MKLLIKTPTTNFYYHGRNLVIEQHLRPQLIIERADIPEAIAAIMYVAQVESVSREEIAECCTRLEIQSPSMSADPEKPSKKIENFQVGNVVKTLDGTKYVITNGDQLHNAQIEKHEFVCEKAHEDGSFAYMCRSEWCKCRS